MSKEPKPSFTKWLRLTTGWMCQWLRSKANLKSDRPTVYCPYPTPDHEDGFSGTKDEGEVL